MTNHEVIDLFYSEMVNEIFHSNASEDLKERLLSSLDGVRKTVIDSLNVSNK